MIAPRLRSANVADVFILRTKRAGDCIEFQGGLDRRGYGRMRFGDEVLTHRIAYLVLVGEIPEGMHVLHHCDNPRCVRPQHIYLGTHQQNMKDAQVRKRFWSRPGEANPAAKLTPEQVEAIRMEFKPRTRGKGCEALGRKYGVSGTTINLIVRNLSWRT